MNMLKRRIEASSDGLRLAMLISEPVGEPKGIVQIVHGMCEHKERYIPFMEYLSAHGYVCAIHDHRGARRDRAQRRGSRVYVQRRMEGSCGGHQTGSE